MICLPYGAPRMTSPFTRLLHLGNVVVDVVLDVPALPEPGGDVLATGSQTTAGGGFNVMAAAARLGLAVAYGGVIGSGPFAELARAACAAERIEMLQPAKPGLDTGFVVSIVDGTGERTFLTSRGAEATLTAADLAPVRAAPGDAVYLSGYGLAHPSNAPALLGWLGRLGEEHLVVFDPGPLAGSLPGDVLDPVLARADWVTCNARESALLTGARDPGDALRLLAGRLPRAESWSGPGRTGACWAAVVSPRSTCRAFPSRLWTLTVPGTRTRARSWPPWRRERHRPRLCAELMRRRCCR